MNGGRRPTRGKGRKPNKPRRNYLVEVWAISMRIPGLTDAAGGAAMLSTTRVALYFAAGWCPMCTQQCTWLQKGAKRICSVRAEGLLNMARLSSHGRLSIAGLEIDWKSMQ